MEVSGQHRVPAAVTLGKRVRAHCTGDWRQVWKRENLLALTGFWTSNPPAQASRYPTAIYMVIRKVSVHLMITIQKVTCNVQSVPCQSPDIYWQSDCLAADRQGQGDTRFKLTPSVITDSNYVIKVSDWNFLKYFCLFCTVIIRCTETFYHPVPSLFQITTETTHTAFCILLREWTKAQAQKPFAALNNPTSYYTWQF
jgi:hypothetical protein